MSLAARHALTSRGSALHRPVDEPVWGAATSSSSDKAKEGDASDSYRSTRPSHPSW
jgi:hypothetical protein